MIGKCIRIGHRYTILYRIDKYFSHSVLQWRSNELVKGGPPLRLWWLFNMLHYTYLIIKNIINGYQLLNIEKNVIVRNVSPHYPPTRLTIILHKYAASGVDWYILVH